ncbi:hypothetical protein CK500_16340 [Halorubrum salipaludis]|uniref:Type I restriction modification DNA specificity domain-containing protein n=1 Tax=Halorubrum salipaludis TaxID=2032630 RepID=A0A2A2F2G7_9EURY|nr:restriction endonuclease subunit S [Halorubrum salipaludis]PAU78802.1 hypothetical protein CK500_16340 [Halorubrum salipaludis]
MSENSTLDEFTTGGKEPHTKDTIDAVPVSTVESSLDETSVGQIPDGWIATRLGDIAEETEYGLTETAEDYDPEKPRYIRTQDFDDFGGLKENSKASLSREKARDGMLEGGDLLFARSGSIGASLGKTYLYDTDDGDCCFGGYSIRHRLQNEGLNHKYISQYTLSNQYWDWVHRRAKTTAQSNINTGEYGSLLIPIPPLPEQRKIATILYTIDQAIEKTEKIIEQSLRVKKGLVQYLLTVGAHEHSTYENYRLGPIDLTKPEDWELKSFEDFSFRVQDGPHITPDYVDEGIPFVSSQNVNPFRENFDYSKYEKYISEGTYKEINQNCRPEKGDLIISRRATIGPTQLIRHNDQFGFFVGVAIIKTNDTVYNSFLEQLYVFTPRSRQPAQRELVRSSHCC